MYTTTIDHITLMDATTKDGESKRNWTTPDGIKCRESWIPANRPDYRRWVKSMGITELGHRTHPLGREQAGRITERQGIAEEPSIIEELRRLW